MRKMWLIALCLAFCTPALAFAQEEGQGAKELRLEILKLDKNLEKLLVRVEGAQGTALQVREVYGDAKSKKAWFVESKAEEKKKLKSLKGKFPVQANVDQMDPKGKVTIMGAPDGRRSYRIMALDNARGRVGVLGQIELKKNSHDEYAKGMLKQVVWLPSGRGVLTVVNQKLEYDDGPYDVDEIQYWKYKFWKIKWIKAEGGDDAEKGAE